MAPAWFSESRRSLLDASRTDRCPLSGLVFAWIGRRRQRKVAKPPVPRRRASYPVFTPQGPADSRKRTSSRPTEATRPIPGRPSRQHYSALPSGPPYNQGFPVQTTHGWGPGQANMTPNAYQAQQVAAMTRQAQMGNSYWNGHVLQNGMAHGNPSQAAATPFPQYTQQYYYFPQGMTQMNAAPVSLNQASVQSPVISSQATSPRTPPAPPAPRRSARVSRTNSAPPSAMPYNQSRGRVLEAFTRYSTFWQGGNASQTLTFDNIPWPVLDSPNRPTSLVLNAVRSFLLSPHHSQGVRARARVETAQVLWEPTNFLNTFGSRIQSDERDLVVRTLHFLQGTLRLLHDEVVSAELTHPGSP